MHTKNAERGVARPPRPRSKGGAVLATLLLGAMGCSEILEIELPDSLTGLALDDPEAAEVLVNSVIGQIECGYTAFTIEAAGFEDSFQATAAVGSAYADYSPEPGEGTCDTSDSESNWFDPLMIGRAFGQEGYERITDWSDTEVPNRESLLGLTALYMAVSLDVFGEHFCDIILDAGPIMTPAGALAEAEKWVNTALSHFATTGDFAGPNDATTSVVTMAYGLRARIRWANGDLANAAADAAMVPDGFYAYATREPGEKRRNKAYFYHSAVGYGLVNGPVDYWTGVDPNPATSQPWPAVIPFTGYIDLAVAADGRAVDASGYPITTATGGSVADPRVPLTAGDQVAQGGAVGHFPMKWTGLEDDVPIINWKEMRLIRAEADPAQAVAHVNAVRAADPTIPPVAYAPAGDEIENMILEERRRALWLEGRFWSTKIQNTDKLWFPRREGFDEHSHDLLGGVRMVYPEDEYLLNPNLDPLDRASGCDGPWESQKPDLGLGSSI